MRIGLNLLYMIPGVVGGTETYARGLLTGLRELSPRYDFVLFVNRECAGIAADRWSAFERCVCPVDAVNRAARYLFEQVKLPALIRDRRIDLLHSLGYTSPLLLPVATVVTVHDLNFRALGGSMPVIRRLMLRLFVGQAILRSTRVVTDSEFSRQEMLKAYGVRPEKITVIYAAADLGDVPAVEEGSVPVAAGFPGIEGHYCAAFSGTSPNKNIPRLIEAFALARAHGKVAHTLVLVGHKPRRAPARTDAVVWTGYLERPQVFQVLRGADFMVCPSLYEGFGLPVLEAMAVGVPVVCSQAASLPEVAGDAAVYFNPYSVGELAEKIALLANDARLRGELSRKGFENLKRFSCRKAATETVAVYEELLVAAKEKPTLRN